MPKPPNRAQFVPQQRMPRYEIAPVGAAHAVLLIRAVSCLWMGAAVFGLYHVLAKQYPDRELVPKLLWVFPPLVLGVILYLGAAWILRRPEIRDLRRPSPERTGSGKTDPTE